MARARLSLGIVQMQKLILRQPILFDAISCLLLPFRYNAHTYGRLVYEVGQKMAAFVPRLPILPRLLAMLDGREIRWRLSVCKASSQYRRRKRGAQEVSTYVYK